MPTVPIQIILLPRTNPRVTLVLKDALAREIDANILATELNTLIIDCSFPIMIDPIPSNPDLPLTPGHKMYLGQMDLGHVPRAGLTNTIHKEHNPQAGKASSPDPSVGIDNNSV